MFRICNQQRNKFVCGVFMNHHGSLEIMLTDDEAAANEYSQEKMMGIINVLSIFGEDGAWQGEVIVDNPPAVKEKENKNG